MMPASSCKGLLDSETALAIMRAVSMPSPEVRPGKMTWPFCSEPIWMFFSIMAATTLGSPTAVTSAWMPVSLAQLRRPWPAITVVTIESKPRY